MVRRSSFSRSRQAGQKSSRKRPRIRLAYPRDTMQNRSAQRESRRALFLTDTLQRLITDTTIPLLLDRRACPYLRSAERTRRRSGCKHTRSVSILRGTLHPDRRLCKSDSNGRAGLHSGTIGDERCRNLQPRDTLSANPDPRMEPLIQIPLGLSHSPGRSMG